MTVPKSGLLELFYRLKCPVKGGCGIAGKIPAKILVRCGDFHESAERDQNRKPGSDPKHDPSISTSLVFLDQWRGIF
jgi:hypothetical protein